MFIEKLIDQDGSKIKHCIVFKSFNINTITIELLVFLGAIASCLSASFYLLFTQGHYSPLYYGDSISHLVIARRIIDPIIPGFIQLGGVWLPMTHLMSLPFVINDNLFHTGLAGTMVSSLSTAITALLLFRIRIRNINQRSDVIVILDSHLRDISFIEVAKQIIYKRPDQILILTTTLPLDIINSINININSNVKTLLKPFKLSKLLPLIGNSS